MKRQKNLKLTIDKSRDKYGFKIVKKCLLEKYINLLNFNPKIDSIIHSKDWFYTNDTLK